ncbi:hypothetical protein QQX98_012311 [Neonectria punicea]|uniref:Uncharacterized protein n=1 Tax=Neonectria punicea TaxID=979145 RepID=A0ABR1GJF1_9HYPO
MDAPPPPDHPSAAMWAFLHGPALKDIQPHSNGFWVMAGHDEDTFRLGFVHQPTLEEPTELMYQNFRPMRTVMEVQKHAPGLIYEYKGEETAIPEVDDGFALPDESEDRAVHLTYPRNTEGLIQTYGLEPPHLLQDISPEYARHTQDNAAAQAAQSAFPQIMPAQDQQMLAHGGDQQHHLQLYGGQEQQQQQVGPVFMNDGSWSFAVPRRPNVDGLPTNTVAPQNLFQDGGAAVGSSTEDQNMDQDGGITWGELPDDDHDDHDETPPDDDEQMAHPNL